MLRGNLTDEAYAERLRSLGLRFFCYRLDEDELVEHKLQSMLRISAGIAASIARASGLASSAEAASGLPDQSTEADIDPKAAKGTDPDGDMEKGQQTPDNDGAEQMDVDTDNEEPAREATVQLQLQLPAGFSLHVWRDRKSKRRTQCLHVHVKGHCKRCNTNPVLNCPATLRAFLQKHGSCRCTFTLPTYHSVDLHASSLRWPVSSCLCSLKSRHLWHTYRTGGSDTLMANLTYCL